MALSPTTQKTIASAVTAAGVYVLFFGLPFQGTISNYVHNRQVLKARKMAYEHEERMAKIKEESDKE